MGLRDVRNRFLRPRITPGQLPGGCGAMSKLDTSGMAFKFYRGSRLMVVAEPFLGLITVPSHQFDLDFLGLVVWDHSGRI
jgi:hypothetical protein